MTRRDLCSAVGRRARRLPPEKAARAWNNLAVQLEDMEHVDMPKFKDLLGAVRSANLYAAWFK